MPSSKSTQSEQAGKRIPFPLFDSSLPLTAEQWLCSFLKSINKFFNRQHNFIKLGLSHPDDDPQPKESKIMNRIMSPIFKSVLNALIGKSEDIIRDVFFDERDQKQLENILSEKSITLTRLGQAMNFYPGIKGSGCHEIAFFVSLKDQPSRARLKLRKYLPFEEMLKAVVRHCQGSCRHRTRHIGIITDSIDNETLCFWRSNLIAINDNIEVEFYLVVADQTIRIDITNP